MPEDEEKYQEPIITEQCFLTHTIIKYWNILTLEIFCEYLIILSLDAVQKSF